MKKLSYPSAVLLLAFGLVQTGHAQVTKLGQAGMPFLTIDVGSRSAAMGGTYASVNGSANDMFYNPAGLALVEGFEASTTVTNWIADIKHYGGGAAYRLGNIGTFGISAIWMDYGDLRRTIPALDAANPSAEERNQGFIDGGTFGVTEYALGISYARQITSAFYVGGHLRYAQQDLGAMDIFNERTGEIEQDVENAVSNIVFDFGTFYYTGFKDLRFGVSFRNFSNQADYYDQRFELPLALNFGVAMDVLQLAPMAGPENNSSLTVAFDWLHPRDFEERLHLGLEYGFIDTVFLRGGYKFNYDSQGFTAGLGVRAGVGGYGLKADYAYVDSNEFFGQIHRVTLGIYGRP